MLLATAARLQHVIPHAHVRVHYVSEVSPVRALVGDSSARVTNRKGASYLGADISADLQRNLYMQLLTGAPVTFNRPSRGAPIRHQLLASGLGWQRSL